MAAATEPYMASCDGCMRVFRERGLSGSNISFPHDVGYLTSSCSEGSFEQCLMVEPRVMMKSVLKATAAAMSTKHQTLPSIHECISPKSFPISSALLGCNLEEAIFSFNSISSNDDCRFDASWQGFLRSLDGSAFSEERRSDELRPVSDDSPSKTTIDESSSRTSHCLSPDPSTSEITPEGNILDEIMFQTLSDVVMATQDETTFEEKLRISKETATPKRGRKVAGQKKERKGPRLQPYSRKTVPIVEAEQDQETPRGASEAPFNFTVLPSIEDVPGDEVSSRRPTLSDEDRKKLEAQFMEFSGPESSSSGGSIRGKLKWISHNAASPTAVRRKQASTVSLDEVVHKARRDSIHKVAGVHDGTRKRRAKSERWIRC